MATVLCDLGLQQMLKKKTKEGRLERNEGSRGDKGPSMTDLVTDWIWGSEDEGDQEWCPVFCLGNWVVIVSFFQGSSCC